MYKVDLHTHSTASPDGGLTIDDYRRMLEQDTLDYIAITDHDTIDFAIQARATLGDMIIIGEEITTREGEVIGLFLQTAVPAGLSLAEAVAAIKSQGGLVYIPHPFEIMRKGLPKESLDGIATQVDIVEICNGRAMFHNHALRAEDWARDHRIAGAASSDAHGWHGWGKTYSVIDRIPAAGTLPQVLQAARYQVGFIGPRGALYPKYNRMRKALKHAS